MVISRGDVCRAELPEPMGSGPVMYQFKISFGAAVHVLRPP